MKILDLSGNWNYCEDLEDCGLMQGFYRQRLSGENFLLPGSACGNHIGKKQEYYESYSSEAVRSPRERYEYIGPLWLQREVEVPEEFAGKSVSLYLERVNVASRLWLDGEPIKRQITELSVPHIYDLTQKLTPGKHLLTLRIDNRNLLNIGDMSSGYSIDTQGYWCGIIGRIELQCREIFHIEDIQVYPGEDGIDIRLLQTSDLHTPSGRRQAAFELTVYTPDGSSLGTRRFESVLFHKVQPLYFHYDFQTGMAGAEKIQWWDEFHPVLYRLKARCIYEGQSEETEVSFGMRLLRREGKKMLLNHRQISLRGTTNCAIFPLTGYPAMDRDYWKRYFALMKSYGMNHVRFHAWCPPENAFSAADEAGIYLSVEMPLWLNRDVTEPELGEDPMHRGYFEQEAMNISGTYGNHPSFLLFSNGNENLGDFGILEEITTRIKAWDPRRLYTLTSNFDHPILPCEDYLCAFKAGGNGIRLQFIHKQAAESTCADYRKAVEELPVPIISFEVGQYCVYPDVDSIEKYTGNMLPVNFDVIRKKMKEKGVYGRLREYVAASGNLAGKLYKEDIECALRTADFGGFGLLSLCDYTGQKTATVGLLDIFGENKGAVTAEEFRQFCGPVVPLWKARRIYRNTEVLEAELALYDFGPERIKNPKFHLSLSIDGEPFYETKTTETKVRIPLAGIRRSAMLKVTLEVGEYRNFWRVYVYTQEEADTAPAQSGIKVVRTGADLKKLAKEGGRAIVTAECFARTMEGSFVPVFWSPAYFPSQKPCGAIIAKKHPVFDNFPTECYPDYQWEKLLDHSKGLDISGFPKGFAPIVETVPNFVDNTPGSPLFEARIGKAAVLYCGFDLEEEDVTVQALKKSILRYMTSDDFCPEMEVPLDSLALS